MPTISELVEQRRRFLDLSYRELAERSGRAGWHVNHQTIQALAVKEPREWPKKPETIKGLAEALDVPEHLVVLAFARSFGLDVKIERSRLASLLPSDASALPSRVQDSIALLVRALVDAKNEETSDGTTTNQAGVGPADEPRSQVEKFAQNVLSRQAQETARTGLEKMLQTPGEKRKRGRPDGR